MKRIIIFSIILLISLPSVSPAFEQIPLTGEKFRIEIRRDIGGELFWIYLKYYADDLLMAEVFWASEEPDGTAKNVICAVYQKSGDKTWYRKKIIDGRDQSFLIHGNQLLQYRIYKAGSDFEDEVGRLYATFVAGRFVIFNEIGLVVEKGVTGVNNQPIEIGEPVWLFPPQIKFSLKSAIMVLQMMVGNSSSLQEGDAQTLLRKLQ